mgnify:CR=1 FL=1
MPTSGTTGSAKRDAKAGAKADAKAETTPRAPTDAKGDANGGASGDPKGEPRGATPAASAPPTGGAKAFEPLGKKQVAHFEKRLLEERKRVLKELGHHGETFGASQQESDGDLSSYSFHMADQGTDAMEREKAFLFASQEGRFLWHIDQALRRLYREPETFGRCHSCGGAIAFERLDALPHARYCIDCKQREEDAKRGG